MLPLRDIFDLKRLKKKTFEVWTSELVQTFEEKGQEVFFSKLSQVFTQSLLSITICLQNEKILLKKVKNVIKNENKESYLAG